MPGLNADFLSRSELEALGFPVLGDDVLVHRTAVLVRCETICLRSRVRIDPYVVMSVGGGLTIGSNVHVAAHCSLSGRAPIALAEFSGLSQGVRIFSSSDDYRSGSLTNPTVPEEFKTVRSAPVHIGRHAIIGAGTVVLPGTELSEGASVGALSLVNRSLEPWSVYAGTPARKVADRCRDALVREADYTAWLLASTKAADA